MRLLLRRLRAARRARSLSPNGDGVDETQSLAYKIVRPSTVTATLVGPDGDRAPLDAGRARPGDLQARLDGADADGQPEIEGLWHWIVSATDDLRPRVDASTAPSGSTTRSARLRCAGARAVRQKGARRSSPASRSRTPRA